MQPKTLLSVTYLKDGICQAEADVKDNTEALRLAASLFQLAQKETLIKTALLTAVQGFLFSPAVQGVIADLAEASAKEKLAKEPKN